MPDWRHYVDAATHLPPMKWLPRRLRLAMFCDYYERWLTATPGRFRSNDEVDAAVHRWHEGDGGGLELHDYLGWTWDQYVRWITTGKRP